MRGKTNKDLPPLFDKWRETNYPHTNLNISTQLITPWTRVFRFAVQEVQRFSLSPSPRYERLNTPMLALLSVGPFTHTYRSLSLKHFKSLCSNSARSPELWYFPGEKGKECMSALLFFYRQAKGLQSVSSWNGLVRYAFIFFLSHQMRLAWMFRCSSKGLPRAS
jgi:hypothetical protein